MQAYQDATMSTADIRERFGIGDSSLYRLLAQRGVAPRRTAESQPRNQKSAAVAEVAPRQTRRRGRTAARTPVAAPQARRTVASDANDGSVHAFRVEFKAVRVVQARHALDALHVVEGLGATDVLEINLQ